MHGTCESHVPNPSCPHPKKSSLLRGCLPPSTAVATLPTNFVTSRNRGRYAVNFTVYLSSFQNLLIWLKFEPKTAMLPVEANNDDDRITFQYCTAESSLPSSSCGGAFPTLGQLLRDVGDVQKADAGDDTPVHHLLGFGSPDTRPVPLVLAFNNLTYSVNVQVQRKFSLSALLPRRRLTERKTLLDDISGEAWDGEILGILGASGAGKSTLIDALANRIAKGKLKGTIALNGEKMQSRMLKVISAYVMQDDLLFPMLTVEETLMFAAEFRLPRTLPTSNKRLRVKTLIDQLGLRNAANTMIGDEGHKGVSGGERRRVSIGIDIIHDPILLFIDEPTSGLDSTNAFKVVQVLKRIVQSGSIVIMSIHQPSYRILGLLDRLIFLSRGQTVFSGSPASLPQFFSEFGHPIPDKENISEFTLELIKQLEGSPQGTRELVEFNRKWQQKKLICRSATQTTPHKGLSLKEAISASISLSGSVELDRASTLSPYTNLPWIETLILSRRYIINWTRMSELIITRLATVMVTGFLLATVYWQLDESPRGAQERFSFISLCTAAMLFLCSDSLPTFIQERYIFMRERTYNAYRISSYVISHTLVTLPQLFALSVTFAAITFWSVGLNGGFPGFIYYCFVIYASFWSGNSFVSFISSVLPNVMISYIVTLSVLSYSLLFGGFYINRDKIPPYLLLFHYISLSKYPYEALAQSEFGDSSRCFMKGIEIFDNSILAGISEEMKEKLLETMSNSIGMSVTKSTCLIMGQDILKQSNIIELNKWECLWITIAWGFLFRILFYFSLRFGNNKKRK